MKTYIVNSPRVGVVGETYTGDSSNIEYLLAGGFIIEPKTGDKKSATIVDKASGVPEKLGE